MLVNTSYGGKRSPFIIGSMDKTKKMLNGEYLNILRIHLCFTTASDFGNEPPTTNDSTRISTVLTLSAIEHIILTINIELLVSINNWLDIVLIVVSGHCRLLKIDYRQFKGSG